MVKDYPGEKWKEVKFKFDFTNDYKLEISNSGRLKSYNKTSKGDLLNGTMINGYRIIRLKFSKTREEKTQMKISRLQKQFNTLAKEITADKKQKVVKKLIQEKEEALKLIRKQLDKVFKEDYKYRTINYHALIHRLVAEYFLPKPKPGETKVAHLDYNKLNNKVYNLKWMMPEENFKHQQGSPHVIKEKELLKTGVKQNTHVAKLTVTKVMLLKKLLNQNKPMNQLIKQFKVTETQILRIKRGENWKYIPAAT